VFRLGLSPSFFLRVPIRHMLKLDDSVSFRSVISFFHQIGNWFFRAVHL